MIFGHNDQSSMFFLICINFKHVFRKKLNWSKIFLITCQDLENTFVKIVLRWSQVQEVKVSNLLKSSNFLFAFSLLNDWVNVITCSWNQTSRLNFNFLQKHHLCPSKGSSDMLSILLSIWKLNVTKHTLII